VSLCVLLFVQPSVYLSVSLFHIIAYKKLSYRRRTARRAMVNGMVNVDLYSAIITKVSNALCLWSAMSVKILSTVETSCTTQPQQIELFELEGYSWRTCSKQPRLVDCRIGVVNKLDRRRRRRVLFTMRSTWRGEILSLELGTKIQKEVPLTIAEMPKFHYSTVWDR